MDTVKVCSLALSLAIQLGIKYEHRESWKMLTTFILCIES